MNTRTQPRTAVRGIALGFSTAAVLTACSSGLQTSDLTDASSRMMHPAWAGPVTTPGTQIATVPLGDISIDVFQVGTVAAPTHGRYFDTATGQPFISEGDQLVFFNYVVTNHGAPVDLDYSLITIEAFYNDGSYESSKMDTVDDPALYDDQGVNLSAMPGPFEGRKPYTLGPDETYTLGRNLEYQAGQSITFRATYFPVDAYGEKLLFDKVEGKASAVTH
jgi:hypothetical protein